MSKTLPPLAFNERNALVETCVNNTRDRLNTANIGIKEYEPTDKQNSFLSKSSLIFVNKLPVLAVANTPVQFTADCDNKKIIIPFVGECTFNTGDKNLKFLAGSTAVLLNNTKVTATQTTRSAMIINYDEAKLVETTNNMLGLDAHNSAGLDFTYSRELKLKFGQISFDTIFRNYASVINQLCSQPLMLNKSGLEDNIYSAMSMMIHPKLFMDDMHHQPSSYDRRLLDRTCQYIQANLTQAITLSQLDQISNMSRRKLHYAFQIRFGCTPMQWVRNERLYLARSKLEHAEHWHTVTTIALSSGFNKLSSFAQYYLLEFGELPSATLAKLF